MRDAVVLAPVPAALRPELARSIAAGVDELEEVGVGDVVDVDVEGRHLDAVLGELVVPAEAESRARSAPSVATPAGIARRVACAGGVAAALVAQARARRAASGRAAADATCRAASPGASPRARAPCRSPRRAASRERAARQIESARRERVDDRLVGAPAERQHLVARRPDRRRAAARHRAIDAVGIDAAREQVLEPASTPGLTEPALEQGDDAEGRQVAFVEHDRIAQRDRPGVVGVGIEQVEQPARALAVALVPVDETLAIDRNGGGEWRTTASPFNALVRS